jgi:hypothetical protein
MLPNHFVIESSDKILLRNVLNEILNGFTIDNFENTIGVSKSDLEKLVDYFSGLSKDAQVQLTPAQAWAVHNALHETLRELGNEEFHTRTGFDFAEGQSVLRELGQQLHGTE